MIAQANDDTIARAAALLRAGEVVAFPTETVYGLGADATNATAVARVFEIKARPSFDPLIVHLAAAEDLESVVAAVPPAARVLMQRFWPGPLTLVLPKRAHIPDLVTAGLSSVAVRVPNHAVARALIRAAGCPIAAPSANRFGCVSPTTAAHVAEQLGDAPALILDGGPCRIGVESTVVSLLASVPALLRPGGVTLEELEEAIGAVEVVTAGHERLAPGRTERHYATNTPLTIVASAADIPPDQRSGAALLLARNAPQAGFAYVESLSPDGDLRTAAANLFAALRRLDACGATRIYAETVPEAGLGRAIMDRLRRAATRSDPERD